MRSICVSLFFFAAVGGFVAGSGTAAADPLVGDSVADPDRGISSEPSGYHQHDGFFFRVLLGPAGVAASANDDAETSVSGWGGGLGLALGGAIARNVIIFGEIWSNLTISPDVGSNFEDEVDTGNDVAFGVLGIGPGIAFYLPGNFYLSSTLSFSRLVLDPDTSKDDDESTTDVGLGLSAAAGKEWWISANWGVGLAAQIYLGGMRDGDEVNEDGDDLVFGTVAAMLAFSATYN